MMHYQRLAFWLQFLAKVGSVTCITFSIPAVPPANATGQLATTPVGVSLEFFAFPTYFQNVTSTSTCLQNLKDLTGEWHPLRIGGTTQDRATYDALSTSEVTYSVSSSKDAPLSLTFGPSFISLAKKYDGRVILGLNRRLDNQSNTIVAARQAVSRMRNLDAIELGNEPNFYSSSDPIAHGTSWNASQDVVSQVNWQQSVGSNLSITNLFSAGVYFGTGSFDIASLASQESASLEFVKGFCSHNYPQSASTANLSALMSHNNIATTQGGGGISQTFGAGLWILDYVFHLLHIGVEEIYFHQGTVGNCLYCWWGTSSIGTPYYGAYFATLALAGADQIAPLDDFRTPYAAWGIYKNGHIVKVLLYNSDYYAVNSTSNVPQSNRSFTLTGLTQKKRTISAKRLTAQNGATSQQDRGQIPTFGGQSFTDGTCVISGTPAEETTTISPYGQATFTVGASEALLVDL